MAQNDFILYANASINIDSQATYAADPYTNSGRSSGIWPSSTMNKMLRQASTGSAALASIMASLNLTAIDDGNLPNFVANLLLALAQLGIPPGTELGYHGTVAPNGFVLASGRTIGNASSGGAERANADTVNLFAVLWTNNSLTVSGGRGATAAADFAANKTITLPDMRGRGGLGKDDMGGTAANRITAALNFDGTVLGNSGGSQSHTLTTPEIPSHGHGVTDPGHTHAAVQSDATLRNAWNSGPFENFYASTTTTSGGSTTGISIQNTGGGGAHTILSPGLIRNVLLKL